MIFNYATIVHPEEIEELTGLHWKEFEFTRFAQPNTYVKLNITPKAIADFEEYIDMENRVSYGLSLYEANAHFDMMSRLYNELYLMKKLRMETGNAEDYVLVYIPIERG